MHGIEEILMFDSGELSLTLMGVSHNVFVNMKTKRLYKNVFISCILKHS